MIEWATSARLKKAFLTTTVLGVAACGGGGGGAMSIEGSGVKGPLVNATVTASVFSASASDFIGSQIAAGSTNAAAAITGLSIPVSISGALIIEVTANADTIDLTTDAAPVISRLVTIVPGIANLGNIYPSPLTTLAYSLAVANADSNVAPYAGNNDDSVSEAELVAAFTVASRQVVSTLGFGMAADTDLNSTPPLVTNATDTTAELAAAAAYRTAIEAVSAIIFNLQEEAEANNNATSSTRDSLLSALALDLADGTIDGLNQGAAIDGFSDITDVVAQVTVDPATLIIPGTDTNVSSVEEFMVSETSETGTSSDTTDLEEGGDASADATQASTTPDIDGDEASDADDNCPSIANADQADQDEDLIGDACDDDRDGDAVPNDSDQFPDDSTESVDTDNDQIGNNADPDDDNDGVSDADDDFPLDSTEQTDTDADGVGDNSDPDVDNDGVFNAGDNCPSVANAEQTDSDADGVGDACDATTEMIWDQTNWDDANWQ